MKNKNRFPQIYLAALLIIMYLPIVVVVAYSFNSSVSSVSWEGFSFEWYRKMSQDKDLLKALGNSLVLASISSGAAGLIGTLGAVGISKTSYRGNKMIEYISGLPLMIPEIILGMVFMAFFALIGLTFGMTTLVLGHTAFCIPYVYMMVKARLVGLDPSLEEAAKDWGASSGMVFLDITMPQIMPAVLSGMLLAFAMSLDDVVISIFLTGARTNTLPIKIYTQVKSGVTPKINALCTIILAVTFLLVMLSQWIGKKKN